MLCTLLLKGKAALIAIYIDTFILPNGIHVISGGTYIDTISNVKGGDSIITTILTVNSLPTFANSNVILIKDTLLF